MDAHRKRQQELHPVELSAELIGDSVDTRMRYIHHDKSHKTDAVAEIGIGGEERPRSV